MGNVHPGKKTRVGSKYSSPFLIRELPQENKQNNDQKKKDKKMMIDRI
jgi:hypothetical protein